MFRLIIVDDEAQMAQMIRDLIDWQSIGIDVVAVCNDGTTGLQATMLHKPDIVITDVCMPFMNGIDLIKKAKDAGSKAKFVIVSAFAEFEYARNAMQYGVKHYLIKPCSEGQILSAVNEVIVDMMQESARQSIVSSRNKSSGNENERNFFSSQIESILRICDDCISDPGLSLKWISENKVFANADYLSRKFLQETGHKFKEYLVSLRISKAKELMINKNNSSITDIAEQVGFGDNPQYFSSVFKKNTGMSPYEYKRNLMGKNKVGFV